MKTKKYEIKNKERATRPALVLLVFFVSYSLFPSDARADIVVFKNGRTMSVKAYRVDGDMATLGLREGGEVTFPATIVDHVRPDEVPYPEPAGVSREPGTVEATTPPALTPALVPEQVLAARPYADLIFTIAAANKVDLRLVHAVIEQESNYEARARSKRGAKGLMQLMPDTARQYGVRNSYDPKANLEAGVRHLKDLMSRLELPIALAAYNAGEAAVRRYGGLPPYPETQAYVRNILRRVGS